ncbi:uncharacterized protein LOC116733142 isoform X1 [Xiphophorus hellerii]|uniref:uncharacterized protein LOC116733142 isoform X1 n=1 Tax=Xiphophorus hellerii TaxID=8084 RepID=UPI0013B45104|nr:uncharacterized protein LOC116733142 isoform X1 [Xiphophorus hellerii]XP_032439820.1 uncharacterized protein LOC116733142 isoform X1 [Xiphophorus hellerii]
MKMISRILLLLILSSCLCAATFVVNVTQSSYQAEENHSITLEWTFTTKTQGSWRDLFIYCSLLAPHKESVLYQVHEGVEFPDSQDEQFSGRVQIDKDVLREGRIRLQVSRLRTEDSGQYLCDVKTEDGSSNAEVLLSVTGQVKVVGGHDPIHAKDLILELLVVLLLLEHSSSSSSSHTVLYVATEVNKFFHAGTTTLKMNKGEMMEITEKMANQEMKLKKDLYRTWENQTKVSEFIILT